MNLDNEIRNYTEKDKNNIWHPFTQHSTASENILIERAKGVYLYTSDGRKIIDAISSWWVNLFGHANEQIAEAISKQSQTLEHVIFAGFTHRPAIDLSENLLKILPENQRKIFFSDNGSTAVEVALKMVLQYWYNLGTPKKKIIAFEGAYHGDTFGAMAVGGRNAFNAPFQELMFEVEFIPVPDQNNFENVKQKFIQLTENKDVAAFIFEPLVQGAGGMVIYEAKYLDELIKIAQSNEVLTIADEVMTGFGRTGKYFASLHLTQKPDIFCLSKGITGGFLPLGVTACTQEIFNQFLSDNIFKTFFHGHSYTANPIVCAAANASLNLLQSRDIQESISKIEQSHKQFITSLDGPKIKSKKVQGTILSIEINAKESSYFNPIKEIIYSTALENDVLLRPLGNVVYVMPPYVITNEELEKIYSVIRKILQKV